MIPEYGALGTAKALGEHVVRYLAKELGPRGIRVITIAPGAVDTTALRSMFPDTYEERLAASAAANPLGRGVEMDDAAALVEALCHPQLEMVNGQTITVDGGPLVVSSAGLAGGTQDFPLTLTHLLGRARGINGDAEVVTQLDAEGRLRAGHAGRGRGAGRGARRGRCAGLGLEPGRPGRRLRLEQPAATSRPTGGSPAPGSSCTR